MAKKPKGRKRPSAHAESENAANGSSQLHINTFEDVADSEDDFHVNRDKILLEEEPVQKKRRKIQEEGSIIAKSRYSKLIIG